MTDRSDEERIARSFANRRLHEMASSQRSLKADLEQITQRVQENELLFSRLFALESHLLRATDPEDVCISLLRGLRAEFSLDMVRLWFDRSTFISQHAFHRLSENDLVWVEKDEIIDVGLAHQAVWLVQLGKGEHFVWLEKKDAPLKSMALIILGTLARPFGVLGLGSLQGDRFSPEQGSEFLQHLAQVCSLMLESTVSRERLSRMMVKDRISGAHNPRFFQPYSHQRLSQWFGRQMPVACMAFNLELPQENQETLLSQLVSHLTPLLRHQDILVRQEGAYFILFLPGLRPLQDVDMAEAIVDACTMLPEKDIEQCVTLGCALSTHDEDPSISELLQRAEARRLHLAQTQGYGIAFANADANNETE